MAGGETAKASGCEVVLGDTEDMVLAWLGIDFVAEDARPIDCSVMPSGIMTGTDLVSNGPFGVSASSFSTATKDVYWVIN